MDSDASLLILGSGGHAKSLIDAIEHQGKYRIAGLVSLSQSEFLSKISRNLAVMMIWSHCLIRVFVVQL